MKRLFGFGVVALLATAIASPAGAQSADQLKCQTNSAKTVAKFSGSKVKCLNKCWSLLRKGEAVDCDPAGGRDTGTQACIDAAEAKSNSGQLKKCGGAACPDCYSGGDCTAEAASKTNIAESLVDNQDNPNPGKVHCSGGTVTADQGKCQDNTGKVLTKWVAALSKCSQKCVANEAKGKTDGTCVPPAADTKTVACIDKARPKCVSGVDKKCGAVGATPPCWNGAVDDGNEWCALVESIVNGQYGSYYCGSPSGAFLE